MEFDPGMSQMSVAPLSETRDRLARLAIQIQAGPGLEQSGSAQVEMARLRLILVHHFDDSELRDLCFDLGVDYDSLRGESKSDKARELIAYLDRRGRVSELVNIARRLRPNAAWEESPTSQRVAEEIQALLAQVLALLQPGQISISINIEAHLGSALELLKPVSIAVMDPPVFSWTIGEEIARSCLDVMEVVGDLGPLLAQVTLLSDAEMLWESPALSLILDTPLDVTTEANRVYTLACPPDIYERLEAGKYYWQLALTFYGIGSGGQRVEQTALQQAAFRVLNRWEQEILTAMLTTLILPQDAPGNLACGAIYETFGVYDQAAESYKLALADPRLQRQVYLRLAALYNKQAWGLLGLPDEKPATAPIPVFAREANRYAALAAET